MHQIMNAQSPIKYTSNNARESEYSSSPTNKLPKIQTRSPYDSITPQIEASFNHRSTPLRKSFSMSLILHGNQQTPSNFYIDQLQRFKRNHDIQNKQQRQRQKEILMQKLEQKRSLIMKREEHNKKREDDHLRNMIEKSTLVLEAHRQGLIRNNTFSNSIPINPITLKYEQNMMGRYQKQVDNKAEVRKLVRGHNLQTMGTSGYNILNGATIDHTSRIIEKKKDIEGLYQDKLQRFYSNLRIRPQSLEEMDASPRKGFKYH